MPAVPALLEKVPFSARDRLYTWVPFASRMVQGYGPAGDRRGLVDRRGRAGILPTVDVSAGEILNIRDLVLEIVRGVDDLRIAPRARCLIARNLRSRQLQGLPTDAKDGTQEPTWLTFVKES